MSAHSMYSAKRAMYPVQGPKQFQYPGLSADHEGSEASSSSSRESIKTSSSRSRVHFEEPPVCSGPCCRRRPHHNSHLAAEDQQRAIGVKLFTEPHRFFGLRRLLEHDPKGGPRLHCDVRNPARGIRVVRKEDECSSTDIATQPRLESLVIIYRHTSKVTRIESSQGITVGQVLEAIMSTAQEPVPSSEMGALDPQIQEEVLRAAARRSRRSGDSYVRYCDLLLRSYWFSGLSKDRKLAKLRLMGYDGANVFVAEFTDSATFQTSAAVRWP